VLSHDDLCEGVSQGGRGVVLLDESQARAALIWVKSWPQAEVLVW